jgi:teichuronic acid biosynthesis glycosyltransferase TuaG
MTAEPLVSIITPAYNSAGFIRETIASALAQTLRNFELIVVDDGSSDDTIEVVHRTAAGDPRVIVMLSPHGGPAQARNVGIEAARGRYIALLDSDDVWMRQYLEQQIAVLERTPDCAIVTSNAINRGSTLDGTTIWPQTSGVRKLVLRDLVLEDNAVCIMSVFRRRVVSRIGPFDRAFTGNEDYEYWMRAANAGFGIVQNRRPLGYYRRRAGSVSADEIRMLHGIVAVIESTARTPGLIEHEQEAVARKLASLREALVVSQLRQSLAQQDGLAAALGVKALSELRGSRCLALASRVLMTCPGLFVRAYGLHQTLRTS